jgi:hypothetical protein
LVNDAIQYFGTEGQVNEDNDLFEESRPIFEGPPSVSEQCLQILSDEIPNMWPSHNHGIDVYQHAVQIITDHHQI